MKIDNRIRNNIMSMFPDALLDLKDGQLWIRTQAWQIDASQLLVLQIYGLNVASIMVDGDWLTLIMTKKSTKTVLK